MKLPVVLSSQAEASLLKMAEWWAEHRSVQQAERWQNGFIDALTSLGENPHRGGLARESDRFAVELRELHYGVGSRPSHRAIYTIRPDMVFVIALKHASQDDFTTADFRD